MRPFKRLQVFAKFDSQKCYNTLSNPVVSGLIFARLFTFIKLKMKLKALHYADVAEIQVAVTDELKKVQKRNFRQTFRNCTMAQNPVYTLKEHILNKKRYTFLSCVIDF
jgi:hypothetical protein